MKDSQAYGAFQVVAFVSAVAMAGIAAIALIRFSHISDGSMFAIALMVFCPAALGLGVSFFIYLTAAAAMRAPQRDRDDPLRGDGIREIGR